MLFCGNKRIIFFCVSLFILNGCTKSQQKDNSFVALGSQTYQHIWVYLCGLSRDQDSEFHTNYPILDRIGKKLNITFLAITPQHRCVYFDNKLYWPHDSPEELMRTYQEIMAAVGTRKIEGFVGFSNGGFFLNRLAQYQKLDVPIISIGAAGHLYTKGYDNTLYLVIGKQDIYHYEHALKLYADAQQSNLSSKLIEYDEGHVIPEELMKQLFLNIRDDQ